MKKSATAFDAATSAVLETTQGSPGTRDYLRCQAIVRAVLTAIREPSDAMLQAAAECESSFVADVYTAMIDAALTEAE
jgi:hypothetical protein